MKRSPDGTERPVKVTAYLLLATDEASDWPEASERRRVWMRPAQAAMEVTEGRLIDLLLRLNSTTVW